MKTLGFLLLLAVGLGAAYWTTQRPGEGLDALRDEGRTVVERLSGTAYALRDTVYPALPDIPPADVPPADTPPTPIAETAAETAAQPGVPVAAVPVDEVLDERIAALENGLTRTMSVAESSAVQERLDTLESRLASLGDRESAELSSFAARMETLDTRLDTLAASPPPPGDGVAGGTDSTGTDGAAAALDARLIVLEDALAERRPASAGVAGLQARIDAIDDRLLALADNDARIEGALARLEGLLGAATGNGRARSSDPALVSSIDAVREQVDRLSASGFVTQDELRSWTEDEHVEYKVYFDNNATTVSDGAARVLDAFIAQEADRATGVAIYGFTDRQGSAVYNQQLAQRRAANVRSYLVQNGFDYTRIGNVAGLGEDAAAVLLEDEQEDARQRVVVLFASQP